MTMPNFLIIGAAKCGTDALYSYLAQHPQVYMSPSKEPKFFAVEGEREIPYRGPGDRDWIQRGNNWITTRAHYEALFSGASQEQAIGEASTWYIYDEHAPQRIKRYIPQAKLIAVLRNPVDRAYSAYTMLLRDARESIRDFQEALAAEDARVRANWEPLWHYRRMGYYYDQLQRYYQLFDASQVHLVLYDDFNKRPSEVMRDIFAFLGIDQHFAPDMSKRANVSMVPKHAAYHMLIEGRNPLKSIAKSVLPATVRDRLKPRLMSPNLVRPAPLAPEVRSQLAEMFRADILQLQAFIGRDLSAWLS